MKKRFAPPVFVVFIALIVLIAVVSCKNNPEEPKVHEHSYVLDDTKWINDDTGHWHILKCSCGDEKKIDITAHTFGDETTTTGTCLEPGTKSSSCNVCGYTKTEKIKTHTFNTDTVPKCTICDGYKCGDNVAGVYDESTKTLTVTGTGPMDDEYTYSDPNSSKSPWFKDSCDITSVIIENGVTSVSKYAFSDEKITSVVLGKDVKELKAGAFRDTCISTIDLPDGVKNIGLFCFYDTQITELYVPSKVDFFNVEPFWYIEGLTAINVDPDNETAVSIDGAVYSKDKSTLIAVVQNKTDYTIPEDIKTIGDYSFAFWKGTEIVIPSSVTKIGDSAFEHSDLSKITFNGGVKIIGDWAFYNSNIEEALLPATVETIGEYAFYNRKLKNVNIGNSIKFIGYRAFYGCKDITIKIDRPSSEESSLDKNNDNWGATNAKVIWSNSTES